jgi:tetratricopeptide (TPR) repeat protein
VTPRTAVRTNWIVAALLAGGTALLFAHVAVHPFIYFDDNRYLTENPVVQAGLSWHGLGWAFTTLHASNWHPLTWLSHMLDVQLFGMSPGAHHLVNVAFHAANAALLFLVLARMTGARGRSAFVAILFAIHPLHVESVAWVAERKDVLSTFFGLLALGAYARYVERPSLRAYALVAVGFAASLLAKPMWVTFPFLLLLLDLWPLRRFEGRRPLSLPSPPVGERVDDTECTAHRASREGRGEGWLLLEKAPLFALVLASSIVTMVAQNHGGAMTGSELGLGPRLGNAAISYAKYLGKTFWPEPLAIFYPHPGDAVPMGQAAAATLLLCAVTAAALWQARRLPFLTVGWLWFLGTLVPVIGIVQVGGQAMADRYTYLPIVGLFIAVSWGAHRLLGTWRDGVPLRAMAAIGAVVLCAATWRQLGFWDDHDKLFRHTIEVTPDNALAQATLAEGLRHEGRLDDALPHAEEAVRINPSSAKHWNNLAMLHMDQGRLEQARDELLQSTRVEPDYALGWSNLGQVELDLGQLDAAAQALQQAIRLTPEDSKAWNRMGQLQLRLGDTQGALAAYRQAVRLQPDYAAAWTNLAVLCQGTGVVAEAGDAFATVTRIQPENPIAWRNLGVFLAKNGQPAEAARAFQRALQLKPGDPDLLQRLALAQAALGR